MQENPSCFTTVTHGLKKEGSPSFDVSMGKLRWGRGLRACRTLFVRPTRASDWYKKRRAL